MVRKSLIVLTLVVLMLGFGLAEAAEGKVMVGSGTLRTEGRGLARLECREAEVSIMGRGVGVIVIKGAEVVRAEGRGRRINQPDGTVYLYGWEGSVFVSGERMLVRIEGGHIEFTATGTGRAFLRGQGSYWVNGREHAWSEDGDTIEMK